MPKPKIFGHLFDAGIRVGLFQIFNHIWPWALTLLAGVAQWLQPVPWPYFVVALAIVISSTLMARVYISDWRGRSRIDNKITINLQSVFQYQLKDDPDKCGYRLLLGVFNSHQVPLSIFVKSLKWELSDKSSEGSDVIETQAMIPPGKITLWSSTINGLSPNTYYDGKFRIKMGVGTEFEKQQFEIEEVASFKISAKTDIPMDCNLPFSSKIIKISITK